MLKHLISIPLFMFFMNSCSPDREVMVKHQDNVVYVKEVVGDFYDPVTFENDGNMVEVFPLTDRDGFQIRGKLIGEESEYKFLSQIADLYCQKMGARFEPLKHSRYDQVNRRNESPNIVIIFGACK